MFHIILSILPKIYIYVEGKSIVRNDNTHTDKQTYIYIPSERGRQADKINREKTGEDLYLESDNEGGNGGKCN